MTDIKDLEFTKLNQTNAFADRDDRQAFSAAKLDDLRSRKSLRIGMAIGIGIFMALQLWALSHFLHHAFKANIVTNTKWLFGGLFGGLFAETYGLTKLMFTWLFKEVSYKPDHEN